MKLDIDKDWCLQAAKREGDAEVAACSPEIAQRAQALARERGHRDIFAEITTATGEKNRASRQPHTCGSHPRPVLASRNAEGAREGRQGVALPAMMRRMRANMIEPRTIIWWSTGAASAITARLILRERPEAIIARCETNNEDPDNYRFEADVMRRLNRSVTLLQSEKYHSVWDAWQGERYMAGNDGAPCTREMKIAPRLAFQRPTDIHVFGYTTDARDVARFKQLKANYPELTLRAPLIQRGLSKAATLAMVQDWGVALPRSYDMGFPNANCLQTGCVKATSPDYWSLYRLRFPDNFARTAAYAREIGARLTRINDARIFIDEIPADWPTTNPIVPACDFLCHIAESEMA